MQWYPWDIYEHTIKKLGNSGKKPLLIIWRGNIPHIKCGGVEPKVLDGTSQK